MPSFTTVHLSARSASSRARPPAPLAVAADRSMRSGAGSPRRLAVSIAALVSIASTPAFAEQPPNWEALSEVPMPAPVDGVAVARPVAPPWCGVVKAPQGFEGSALRRQLEGGARDSKQLIFAAQLTCKWPREPAIGRVVAVIAQHWMNYTGLPQDRALEVLGLRAQAERFEADRQKLCASLTVSEEVEGEEKQFMHARRVLFGCHEDPMWLSGATLGGPFTNVFPFLDMSATPADELVRVANLLANSRFIFGDRTAFFEKNLLHYIMDQVDYHGLSEKAALELLDRAPYKGNIYARAVGLESIARARLAASWVQTEIDAKARDAAWKELLITAPQRGIAAFTEAATRYKAQLARSNAFERAFWGPSRKAVQGCWPTLRKDYLDVLASMKHGTEPELVEAQNHPIAALLFTRLAACAAVEADPAYANRLLGLSRDIRYARGVRTAAYYAALEALGPIKDDRAKFPVSTADLHLFKDRALTDAASRLPDTSKSTIDSMGWVGEDGEGTVKSVKKSGDKVVVTFATTKVRYMSYHCVPTNRIMQIRPDGTLVYYERCKEAGYRYLDVTPSPIHVPVEWADGIKPGAVVKFDASRGTGARRIGLPVAVFADAKKNKPRMKLCTSGSAGSGIAATPRLAVTGMRVPSWTIASCSIDARIRSASVRALSRSVCRHRTANSSPP